MNINICSYLHYFYEFERPYLILYKITETMIFIGEIAINRWTINGRYDTNLQTLKIALKGAENYIKMKFSCVLYKN